LRRTWLFSAEESPKKAIFFIFTIQVTHGAIVFFGSVSLHLGDEKALHLAFAD
jgi:hypothetical protein